MWIPVVHLCATCQRYAKGTGGKESRTCSKRLHAVETRKSSVMRHDQMSDVEHKFHLRFQVWTAYQLSRLRRGDDAGARQVLQRSLQSLSKHKHISVISRYDCVPSILVAAAIMDALLVHLPRSY